MLKAPRVPIAVVFSAPPTSPLSKVEQWNVKSFVHGWDERAPSNVVFYHSSQKYANNNNWMCTGVVHTLWVYIRIVRWLECEGEEEGRGNRDLIEWLPGKLVYSRFLPTTSRRRMPRRMCGCGGNPLSALSGHLSTQCTNTCTSYMCACSCQVRSMEPLPFHAPPTPIELEGSVKKLVVASLPHCLKWKLRPIQWVLMVGVFNIHVVAIWIHI